MPDVQDPPRRVKTASWWLQVATALLFGGLPVNWGELAFLLFILDLKIAGFTRVLSLAQSALCWARRCSSLLERRPVCKQPIDRTHLMVNCEL